MLVVIGPWTLSTGQEAGPSKFNQIGQSFAVPYRLTDTNHFLVRARINGKGPFNFLVDSGAPAFFIATETAKKVDLKSDPADFWTSVDLLELEGGAKLAKIKARIDDPFQLVGMNALGLPGASIDGILGFTILARFRLQIDLTDDRMVWTRLDYDPRDPPAPKPQEGNNRNTPAGVQAMNALGPLAKGLAMLVGKQPEEQLKPRGFLGLTWAERDEGRGRHLYIQDVFANSPAATGGLQNGDQIVRINDRVIETIKDARGALVNLEAGNRVRLIVLRRDGTTIQEVAITLKATEGL
jgi:hypothetical protein